LPRSLANQTNTPAHAPFGRFHHSGQIAAYGSLTAEGAGVAVQRYLTDGVDRMLVPMWLNVQHVADIRGIAAASIVWQDIYHDDQSSPTWSFSDAARDLGADAMLYSSRSRPDLSHVVIFQPELLSYVGPTTLFSHP
uniref:RES family NAD+ phosphorylase n=1 Tax=Sphingomonas sp. TaxID=28214 RepID=UPI0025E02B4D